MEIKGSHVLITGGNSGIGKETAKQLVALGAKVVITGRDEEKLNKVAQEIGAIPLLFDISDLTSIPAKSREAFISWGAYRVYIYIYIYNSKCSQVLWEALELSSHRHPNNSI